MVYILLGTGFEEAEALVPADLLRRAGAEVSLVSLDAPTVTGAHGITVCADISLADLSLDTMEMLILPGGLGGVEAISASSAARSVIQSAYAHNCWIGAICAAPTLLAKMGLLNGRRAICYPGMEDEMPGAIPTTSPEVIVDGSFITARGPGSAFAFGLALVTQLLGQEAADAMNAHLHYGV